MSRRCTISGKKPLNGHKVSHANKKANKISYVNLIEKRFFDSDSNKWVRVKVSARMMRTIAKNGFAATLRAEGIKVSDLR